MDNPDKQTSDEQTSRGRASTNAVDECEELRAKVRELEGQLEEARAASMDAAREHGVTAKQLEEALRRLEGLGAELTMQHQKVEALLHVLKRITTHRWYRLWDRIRKITGKPALHGRRDDPIGIKSGMPM